MPKGRTDDIPLGFTLNERGMKTGADKRRHARLKQSPKDLAILVDDGSGKVQRFNATLIDSTPEGVGIECAVPLEVGLRATVVGHQSAPDSPGVRQSARVAWSTAVRPGVFVIGLHLDSRRRESSQSPNGNEPETPLDYYDLLEVSDKATPDTIHRVYRMLAQRYHPDHPETGDEKVFKDLLAAYRVLSDPEQRAAYDVQRHVRNGRRWVIFDSAEAARGPEAEKRKRHGILGLLYTKRVNQPGQPGMGIQELEELLGCPREQLEFSLWYLKESGFVVRTDNGRYSITVKGADEAEKSGAFGARQDRLLPAAGTS